MQPELKEFLSILRRAFRLMRSTGDTRRGLLYVKGYLNRAVQ